MTKRPDVRRLEQYRPLDKEGLRRRFLERFADPAFEEVSTELAAVFEKVWDGYIDNRKAPRTTAASRVEGQWSDPTYELSNDWIRARAAIRAAEREHRAPDGATRVLLVNASTRSEHTCPGEISKTRRLVAIAREALEENDVEVDVLDLSTLADEPMKVIHPCKACVSTAMPLCHWPCSCYPNHALGQTNDWMNELYPRFIRAHGVMIVCPVHWYQTPAPLKLIMDRLVCADGGNPDPTSTGGKKADQAKAMELAGWDYPRHLAGRGFAVVAHGDAEGAEEVRDQLRRWLSDMGLIQAGPTGALARQIGYYRPYATSHEDLDADEAVLRECANAARSLARLVAGRRAGRYREPDAGIERVRDK